MPVVAFPAITPNAASFGLLSSTQNSRSALNGVIQTLALPGDIWTTQMTFSNKFGTEANQLRGFLASMRGRSGRFTMSPPGYHGPYGDISGEQTATWLSGGSIITSADAVSADSTIVTADSILTGDGSRYWLQPGDYFEILGELKIVTATTPNETLGNCVIEFVPPLRQAVPTGTAIITEEPKCTMQLVDDNQAQWQQTPGRIYAMSIAAQEALDL